MDGLYFKQGLNTGLLSLCVEGDRGSAIHKLRIPPLTCSALLKCEKALKLPMALKKMWKTSYFGVVFHEENIVKLSAIYKFVFVQG